MKVLTLVIFAMAYGLATTTPFTTAFVVKFPASCNGYYSLFNAPCYFVLNYPESNFKPPDTCCFYANEAFQFALLDKTNKRVKDLCDCLGFSVKSLNYNPNKLVRLPDACGIKLPFPMDICMLFVPHVEPKA